MKKECDTCTFGEDTEKEKVKCSLDDEVHASHFCCRYYSSCLGSDDNE